MTLFAVACLLVAFVALWVTRNTWYVPWERPATINVVCQTFKIGIVASPAASFWISSKLHTMTGVWNLEQLVSALGYFVGMFSVLYLVADRLDMTREQMYSFVKYRIGAPACIAMSLMTAIFVTGPGKAYVPDTVAAVTTPWLRAYWLVIAVSLSYILTLVTQALLVLRRDPRSRRAANSYLCAVGVSAACIVAFQLEIPLLQWVCIRVEVVAYAVAASYTWHSKQRVDVPSDYLLPG